LGEGEETDREGKRGDIIGSTAARAPRKKEKPALCRGKET